MKTIHKILMLATFSVLLFACADNTLLMLWKSRKA